MKNEDWLLLGGGIIAVSYFAPEIVRKIGGVIAGGTVGAVTGVVSGGIDELAQRQTTIYNAAPYWYQPTLQFNPLANIGAWFGLKPY
jgi:hypothetical protein